MSARLQIRHVITVVTLTAAWCGLWRSVSVANVMSGLAFSSLIVASGVGTAGRGSVRIAPLLRVAGIVLADLAQSTVQVAKEILTPTDYTDEAVIAVDVPVRSRHHFLFLTIAITLTPGTAVVDTDPDTGRLYLHLLHADRRDETEGHVRRLAELVCQALPIRPVGVVG